MLAHWFRIKDSANEKEIHKAAKAVPVAKKHEAAFEPARSIPLKAVGKVSGIDSLLTKFALCCKPLPGDSIIGYITQNRRATIPLSNFTKNFFFF